MIAPETHSLGILARWYAEPLGHEQARQLFSLAERREQQRLKRHGTAYLSPLLKLIALHWLGEAIEGHYHYLISTTSRSMHAQILKPFIYGQLLMSKKKTGAMEHLNQAFHQARLLLKPEDYFHLMKRHKMLDNIPLCEQPNAGETLSELMVTAGVIERMKQSRNERPGYNHDPNDTYG